MLYSRVTILVVILAATTSAQERRAPPPQFNPEQLNGVFFDKLSDAIRGQRPSLSSLREAKSPATSTSADPSPTTESEDRWSSLIQPSVLEDEVKRVKLHLDSVITTPSSFSSGGFQTARQDLTVLATLFAVINEHSGDVRWKKDAASARDLLARTAFNCKAGSGSVYNEAKLRKADLQDLLSGSGIVTRESEPAQDWSQIADRSPLMEYSESLIKSLADATNDSDAIQSNADKIARNAQLIAMLGEAIRQPGMDDADDEDYAKLSNAMSVSATNLTLAIERSETEAVQQAVGEIRKRCDACHEQYR